MLEKLDLVADVGGEYIPEKMMLDHHQKSFTEVWLAGDPKYAGIKLSSAGLVYRHFGKEILTNILKETWNINLDEPALEKAYKKLYNKFILEVDAQDNGVDIAEKMRYTVGTHLGARVARFNLDWDAPENACVHT